MVNNLNGRGDKVPLSDGSSRVGSPRHREKGGGGRSDLITDRLNASASAPAPPHMCARANKDIRGVHLRQGRWSRTCDVTCGVIE